MLLFITPNLSFSQEQRLKDRNTIGWFVYTGTFKIRQKLSLHTEYQWRRINGISSWQQGLFRTGINYSFHKDVSLNAGYAFAETFTYGDYPNSSAFPEHRIFEQAVLKHEIAKIELSHRFTAEQRFVGKPEIVNTKKNFNWSYLNRFRYRLRTEIPVNLKTGIPNKWRIVLQDEVFVGWGKNIGTNIFDQNRIGLLVGYKINSTLKIEVGYLNQILQQAKRINDRAVFQYNNGFTLATHLSF